MMKRPTRAMAARNPVRELPGTALSTVRGGDAATGDHYDYKYVPVRRISG
jgi:hypothetical protein